MKNAAFLSSVDRCAEALQGVPSTTIGPAMGKIVRGEEVAGAHKSALLRLCFLQHVLQPALHLGALVTSMMRSQLLEAGASDLNEMIEDIRVAIAAAEEEHGDLRLWLLVDEGMRRGFEGTRAQAAARAGEIWELSDDVVAQLIAEGVPRGKK